MELARITSRGQTTIPKRIREGANLHAGDVIAFEIEGTHVVVRKVSGRDTYLQGLSDSMTEWASQEDEEAWRDL
ncbi:MAG: AbrB/MazE/SpoVT family DNA-binding domain-containing protein [Gammaproteobacteria bacterium]|nr:AbrB/MazE/SpoVT family DNA-binding domain-containing protein [Gammaproteobacteria bacterium]